MLEFLRIMLDARFEDRDERGASAVEPASRAPRPGLAGHRDRERDLHAAERGHRALSP